MPSLQHQFVTETKSMSRKSSYLLCSPHLWVFLYFYLDEIFPWKRQMPHLQYDLECVSLRKDFKLMMSLLSSQPIRSISQFEIQPNFLFWIFFVPFLISEISRSHSDIVFMSRVPLLVMLLFSFCFRITFSFFPIDSKIQVLISIRLWTEGPVG